MTAKPIMFTSASHTHQVNAYNNIHLETGVHGADPHQLVALLLEGAISAISAAVAGLERGDIAAKCKAISKGSLIIDAGLRGALDMQSGGQVAATLQDLYSCVPLRLTRANLQNDADMLRECNLLLAPIRDAWNSIKPHKFAG